TMADVGERVVQPGRRVEAQVDVVAGDAILPLAVERIVGGDAHVRANLALDTEGRLIAVRILRVRWSDRLPERAADAAGPEVHVAERLLEILRLRQRAVPRIDGEVGAPVVERRQHALRVGEADRVRHLVDELREVLPGASSNDGAAV